MIRQTRWGVILAALWGATSGVGISCGAAEDGDGVGVPAVPSFPAEIDALAAYEAQTTCDPTEKPGVTGFRDLILATYPGTTDMGIVRGCDVGGTSEHKEGRAWDWGVTPAEEASAILLDWLLAEDEYGNSFAMARRFGIMYIIFDGGIWGSSKADQGWRVYEGESPHTDHVHFSFSWDGALQQTSYWR